MSTFLLALIHIEREWIILTCTWLVVWGRVKIRFQRRPSVNFSRLISQQINVFSLSYSHLPLLARKHHLETFESWTARALAPLCSYVACFNANIDSCLLGLDLNCMPYCFT